MQPPEKHTNYAPSQFRMLQKPDIINNPQYTEDEYGQYSQKSACELCPGKNCKGCSINPDGINYIGNIHTLEDIPEEFGTEVFIAIKQGGFAEKAARWKDPNDTSIPPHIKNRDVANFAFYKPEINTTFGGQLKQNGDIALVVVKGNQLKTIAQTAPKLIPEVPKPSTIPSSISANDAPVSYHQKPTEPTSNTFVVGPIQHQEFQSATQQYPPSVPSLEGKTSITSINDYAGSIDVPVIPRAEIKTAVPTKIQSFPQTETYNDLQTTQIQQIIQPTKLIFIPQEDITSWLNFQKNTWELTVPDNYQFPIKPSRKRYSREKTSPPIITTETPIPDETITLTPFEKMIQTHTDARHMLFEFLTELVPENSRASLIGNERQVLSDELIQQPTQEILINKPFQLIKQFLLASGAKEKTISGNINPATRQEEVIIDLVLPITEQIILEQMTSPPDQSDTTQHMLTHESSLDTKSTTPSEQAVTTQPTATAEKKIIRIISRKDKETTIILSETAAKTIIQRLKKYVSSHILTEDIEIAPQEDHSRIANIVSPYTDTFIGLIVISTLLFINQLLAYNDSMEQSKVKSIIIPL